MASITKTAGIDLLTLQSVSASSVLQQGTPTDVSTKLGGTVFISFGRLAATAAGAGVNIRIEASAEDSGDSDWYPLAVFTTAYAAVEAEDMTATEPVGETVLAVASTTNLTAGDVIFIENATIGNSEWHRIKAISAGASVTIEEVSGLAFQQTNTSNIFDGAEHFVAQLSFVAIKRIRVVADGSLFTQAFAIKAKMVTGDSIG